MTAAGERERVPDGARLRPRHLLALVPSLGMLGGVPFANSVHRIVFGLPFLALWILCWVLATAGFMTLLYWLDGRAAAQEAAGSP